ncbi:LamB/YcsF family protein [Nakamurella silvestris]|nr:LamB/YcsF family protein [Nakamurella silvestris]
MAADAQRSIDLNADVGEGFGRWELGDDEALLTQVSSANIACGFHAGDPRRLLEVCRIAVANGVAIGAQVSYRDLAGFGRRFIDVEPADLTADVLYQIGALDGLARSVGGSVSYVKPHGALYNTVVHHEDQAAAVIVAVAAYDRELAVLGLSGSGPSRTELAVQAERAGLRFVREAFADRAYTAEGTLVSRRLPGAVLTDPAAVAAQALSIATTGTVRSIDGTAVEIDAESLCLHGDSPGAADLAVHLRAILTGTGMPVASFLPPAAATNRSAADSPGR